VCCDVQQSPSSPPQWLVLVISRKAFLGRPRPTCWGRWNPRIENIGARRLRRHWAEHLLRVGFQTMRFSCKADWAICNKVSVLISVCLLQLHARRGEESSKSRVITAQQDGGVFQQAPCFWGVKVQAWFESAFRSFLLNVIWRSATKPGRARKGKEGKRKVVIIPRDLYPYLASNGTLGRSTCHRRPPKCINRLLTGTSLKRAAKNAERGLIICETLNLRIIELRLALCSTLKIVAWSDLVRLI